MRLRRPNKKEAPETMLPLINIVFMLLIFFMLLANFNASAPFSVTPPDAADSAPTQQGLTIFVAADGRLAVDGEEVSPTALVPRLRERLSADPPPVVWLRADRDVDADRVIAVMERLRIAGVVTLRLTVNR